MEKVKRARENELLILNKKVFKFNHKADVSVLMAKDQKRWIIKWINFIFICKNLSEYITPTFISFFLFLNFVVGITTVVNRHILILTYCLIGNQALASTHSNLACKYYFLFVDFVYSIENLLELFWLFQHSASIVFFEDFQETYCLNIWFFEGAKSVPHWPRSRINNDLFSIILCCSFQAFIIHYRMLV